MIIRQEQRTSHKYETIGISLILCMVPLFLRPPSAESQSTVPSGTGVVAPPLIMFNSDNDPGSGTTLIFSPNTDVHKSAQDKSLPGTSTTGESATEPPKTGIAAPATPGAAGATNPPPSESAAADTTNSGKATQSSSNGASEDPAQKKSLAQFVGAPDPTRRATLPGITGTVKIRRPFKIFAQETLIHNLSFRDTPVKEIIAELARRGSLNIIIDKSVVGRITGELRDVTLNEAMDSILAAAGLQSRTLDDNTVIVATTQAIVQLGLNRPAARAFKLSYAHPYDVAMILHASIFNKGLVPDFQKRQSIRNSNDKTDESATDRESKTGGPQATGMVNETTRGRNAEADKDISETENQQVSRPDQQRTIRGSSRSQTQEGVGFNNAAVDPGSQQIRTFQEVNTDYIVEQNGGGPIVIPDVKNRQVIVVGTVEDLNIAEESIRLLDKRPKQVHIQASLIELTNQGIRQLGTNLAVQGGGASGNLLGNSSAPLVNYLPGLGSPSFAAPNAVTPSAPGTAYTGLLGNLITAVNPIAGLQAEGVSQSALNFLTLSKAAGGRANIATLPQALNISLNLLLQTNKAKIVANPSVVVIDNTEALITIAQEVVHKVTSTVSLGVVTTNVELTKAGIFLDVLPKVTEDGFITMRLRPQVSEPIGSPLIFGTGPNPTVVTLLSVREIMTQEVRVKDGQTLVLGGLFTEQEAANLAKVPYLAETPIFGALFRNTLKGRDRDELMLLLTPKIVEEEPVSAVTETLPQPTM